MYYSKLDNAIVPLHRFKHTWHSAAITVSDAASYERLIGALNAPHNISSIDISVTNGAPHVPSRMSAEILEIFARSPTIKEISFNNMTFFAPDSEASGGK